LANKNHHHDRGGFALRRRSKLDWFLVCLFVGCGVYLSANWLEKLRQRQDNQHNHQHVQTLVDSEELILALTPGLKALNRSVLNLRLPDHGGRSLLSEQIDVSDLLLESSPSISGQHATLGVTRALWPLEPVVKQRATEDLRLWRPLLETVEYFEHAKFYFRSGHFPGGRADVFHSDMSFSGLARLKNGTWRAVKAHQEVHWRNESTGDGIPDWRISTWRLKQFTITDSRRLFFEESLEKALPDREQRLRARKSHHDDILISHVKQQQLPLAKERYQRYFDPRANGQHPAVVVVDVDGDGWDDLYAMPRWGRNQLFHNQRDGTFVERAADLGLDIDSVSTSAVFADFDNDGDKDLILGRSLERSMYLVNDDGRFIDRSRQLLSFSLPFLVTSVSAADYNGDGLLDVYLSTYGPPINVQGPLKKWLVELLSESESRDLLARFSNPEVGHNPYVNRQGPANWLLVNRGGGRFDVAPEQKQVSVGYNTFQSTWSDFDEDGDPDLYVCNDFSPDVLLRNDGTSGFVDITEPTGGETMRGFGMGASWGDYDNDGQQDLYVSNMYSKAGMRITGQISGLDVRFRQSADGNRLYRHCGDHFKLVSANNPPGLLVTQAGWSWGGQFVDVDNDGFLDIYVTSGYYTVPDAIASEVDL
jgi:hypothetical protein